MTFKINITKKCGSQDKKLRERERERFTGMTAPG
jgi:hypothetical protein